MADYTVTGPTSGPTGARSARIRLTLSPSVTIPPDGYGNPGLLTIDLDDLGAGGTFSPSSVDFSQSTRDTYAFYTAPADGGVTLRFGNNGGIADATDLAYTAVTGVCASYAVAAPTMTLAGTASSAITLTLGSGTVPGTVTFTPVDYGPNGGSTVFTPATVQCTNGSRTATLTATNATAGPMNIYLTNDGNLENPNPVTIINAPATVVTVDSTWIAANGGTNGPWPLYGVNTTYQLATDLTATGIAFELMANGQVLDLNGHTVTYDNDTFLGSQIPNPGFETGDFTGWDVSNAPSAAVVPATTGFDGSYMVRWNLASGATEWLDSAVITLPAASIPYIAGFLAKQTAGTTGALSFTVQAVDSVTGTVYATYTQNPGTVGNGGLVNWASTLSYWTPLVGQTSVKLRAKVVTTAAVTLCLDSASVARCKNVGITTGYNRSNLCVTSSRPGGTVTQGTAQSTLSQAIDWSKGVSGYNVMTGLAVNCGTQDASGVVFSYCTNTTVRGNTITMTTTRQTDRQALQAAIGVTGPTSGSAGELHIDGNTITGTIQTGIFATGQLNYARPAGSPVPAVTVNGNSVSHKSKWTNGYCGQLYGLNDSEIAGNTFTPVWGRGLLVETVGKGTLDWIVRDNHVEADESTQQNIEYTVGENAVAFRLRNYGHRIANGKIYGNTFYSHCDNTQDQYAMPVRFNLWQNFQGTGDNAAVENNCRIVIEQNTCRAILVPPLNPSWLNYDAVGMSVASVDSGTGLVIRDNVLQGATASVQVGCNDSAGSPQNDVTFWRNQLVQDTTYSLGSIPSQDGLTRGYVAYDVGAFGFATSGMRFLSSTYSGGASKALDLVAAGSKSLHFGFMLAVTVVDGSGNPQAGATVTVTGVGYVQTAVTNSRGKCLVPACTETWVNTSTAYPNTTSVTGETPLTVAAVLGGNSGSATVSPSSDTALTVTLGGGSSPQILLGLMPAGS